MIALIHVDVVHAVYVSSFDHAFGESECHLSAADVHAYTTTGPRHKDVWVVRKAQIQESNFGVVGNS